MSRLNTCPACDGFVPHSAATCPHCGASHAASSDDVRTLDAHLNLGRLLPRGVVRTAMAIASGSAMCMTLMACYGAPICDGEDADEDGYVNEDECSYQGDCDDDNADIHPGAPDPLGDDIDQNCDGVDGVLDESDGGPDGGDGDGGGGPDGGDASADGGDNDDAGAPADGGGADGGA